jgi:hypothetical protein
MSPGGARRRFRAWPGPRAVQAIRDAWGRLSVEQRQTIASIDNPAVAQACGHCRLNLTAKALMDGRFDVVRRLYTRFGVHELHLAHSEANQYCVWWEPEGGLVDSAIDIIFHRAVQSFPEYTQMTGTVYASLFAALAIAPASKLLDEEAPWRHMGRIFFTTLIMQLINVPPANVPKLRVIRESRRLAASMARAQLKRRMKALLTRWKAACQGPRGARMEKLARSLLACGWRLEVRCTFLHVSETEHQVARSQSGGLPGRFGGRAVR